MFINWYREFENMWIEGTVLVRPLGDDGPIIATYHFTTGFGL